MRNKTAVIRSFLKSEDMRSIRNCFRYFTVLSQQTVRVDMEIDTGIR